VVGNLKFDGAFLAEKPALDVPTLLKKLGVTVDHPILVCGSTHPGEEAILGRVFTRLKKEFPKLFLIVVPRHFERGQEAGSDLQKAGIKLAYRTEVSSSTPSRRPEIECLLVNTTGELRDFYRPATAIFIGKSLVGEGGQNPIEPAALGKPVVFGPNMQNFASITEAFLRADAAVQVSNEAELEQAFRNLLLDSTRRDQLGQRALQVVQDNKGSIDRTVDMIVEHLKDEDIYVAPSASRETS